MTHKLIFGLSVILILFLFGCGVSNPTIATIGDEKITRDYFENDYAKNNGGWDSCARSSLDDRKHFLDLLIKFKLKVKEARSQGLEQDTAVINELDSYNNSVTQSYMIEKEVVDPGVKQMYDRKKEELRASHILIRVRPNASPEDTLKAYKRAMDVIAQIPTVPFDTLAYRYSEDNSAKMNYGDLGYFSAGKMVIEFETACYSMKAGEYTKTPVRTQFGYHIIKITARHPNPGSVRISHILMRFQQDKKDSLTLRDTVWMIYHKLMNGANFGEMAQRYSQDRQSAARNGDIGYYERGRIPPKIADVLSNMKIDSISEPILFNYGYHIFKPTERQSVPSFAETQKDLTDIYKQGAYPYEYKQYLVGLKAQYHILIDSPVVRKLIASVDSNKTSGVEGWEDTLSSEMLKMTIIHSQGRPFTVNDFARHVLTTDDLKNYTLTPHNIWLLANKLLDVVALEDHARHAGDRFPELVGLMKDYKDGILLFRIEQDEVWKKIIVNDSLLKEYYDAHKEEYRWPERVNFAEIYTLTDSAAKAAYWKIRFGEDFLDVAQEYTNRPGYQEKKGVWGFQPFTVNELAHRASKMAIDSVSEPFRDPGEHGWSIIKTLARDSVHIKSFEDASPEVASGYQEAASKQREQDWVDSLRKKFIVTIDQEALKETFKRKRIESQ